MRVQDCGRAFVSMDRCRHRLCPICMAARARRLADSLTETLSNCDDLRHLTLTIPATNEPLRDQIDHLLSAFRRMRQHVDWSLYVRGGVACVQVTRNPDSGLWHPHLHVVIDGTYFPRETLVPMWNRASAGATILHITACHGRGRTASYISRYVTSPNDLNQWPEDAVMEYHGALKGRRLVIAFGSLHSSKIPPREKDTPPGPSRHVVSVAAVQWSYAMGSVEAERLCRLARRHCRPLAISLGVSEENDRDTPDLIPPDVLQEMERLGSIVREQYFANEVVTRPPPKPHRPGQQLTFYRDWNEPPEHQVDTQV